MNSSNSQTDLNTTRENNSRIDYDYKVCGKVFVQKDGILRKTESRYDSEPWTIMSVHTNGADEVHSNLCSHCYKLGMSDPRPDIRCVQYLP